MKLLFSYPKLNELDYSLEAYGLDTWDLPDWNLKQNYFIPHSVQDEFGNPEATFLSKETS